jgi:hypothetical protein
VTPLSTSPSGEIGSSGIFALSDARPLTRVVRFVPGEEIVLRASHPDYQPVEERIATGPFTEAVHVRLGLSEEVTR